MALTINEEQKMLRSSAHTLIQEKSKIEKLRHLRDSRDETGYDTALWSEMAEMGWTALTIPEAYGGLDFGYTGLGQILEETGRTLTASPLVSTVLMSATALRYGGSADQQQQLLTQIAEGSIVMSMAIDEQSQHDPHHVETTATTTASGYTLTGSKIAVIDGHVADKLIVSAQLDGAIQLFVVDADAAGVAIERVIMMDSRNYAKVTLQDVQVGSDALLGSYTGDRTLLEDVLDVSRIGLAAEMLGGIQEAFDRTVAYLKEREQFGVAIGTFQALQHRAAIMFGEIELCKSVVIKGLKAIDEGSADLPRLASLAKAKLGQVYQLVSNEGVQMFGGIGMTDDEEIGFFLKRARVAQRLLGDSNYHLDRLGKMKGI